MMRFQASILIIGCWFLTTLLSLPELLGQEAKLIPQAHAHNDYLHPRPLLDALEQGFGSVEADIFLVGDELQVAHSRNELSPERTLRALYLEPLRERIQKNAGSVYGDGQAFTLLIDIKSEGAATYRALDSMLSEYRQMLARFENDQWHSGAVTVIVSGNRPWELIGQSSPRLVGIDGRLTDLDSQLPAHLLPLISDNWSLHFDWRGEGDLPAQEQKKLDEAIAKAHAHGRRIRFWATPDKPQVWKVLQRAGVDLINTDDLVGLSGFLRKTPTDK